MEYLKITTASEIVRIATDEIVYVMADGNYCDLMLANGSTHNMTFQLHYFEDYFTQLNHNTFFRVGRSLIVNKRYVRVVNIPERTIKFGGHNISREVPVLRMGKLSKDALKTLKNEMNDYE